MRVHGVDLVKLGFGLPEILNKKRCPAIREVLWECGGSACPYHGDCKDNSHEGSLSIDCLGIGLLSEGRRISRAHALTGYSARSSF